MNEQRSSLQEIIKRRQTSGFVGRREEMSTFSQNLMLPVSDIRRRFLFSIHGDAGVGKTYLVHQFARLAREQSCVTAYADESVFDLPALMDRIAGEFERQGKPCRNFRKRSETYQSNLRVLDSDPTTPTDLSSTLTHSAVRISLRAAESIPVVGPFAKDVDSEVVAHQIARVHDFLKGKFKNYDDVRLLLQPVEELTPIFLDDLNAIAADAPIALFFDTYERTGTYLEAWLLDLLSGRHGDLPADIVLTISGQHPLPANLWGGYLGVRSDHELGLFTEGESKELLAGFGVTDTRVVEQVGELTGHLPVLVAMLAGARPQQIDDVSDPSNDAVERFLKWEKDPVRRQAALLGAIPRRLDKETFEAAAGTTFTDDGFSWICQLPFVHERADGFRYHDIVRSTMLRTQRRRSPAEWKKTHECLAAHYHGLLDGLGLGEHGKWMNDRWQAIAAEKHYHNLCANPSVALPEALAALIDSLDHKTLNFARWAGTIRQAGLDCGDAALAKKGEVLTELTFDVENGLMGLLTWLAAEPSIGSRHRAIVFRERSKLNVMLKRLDDALDDIDRAIELAPNNPRLASTRGDILRQKHRYDDALDELNRAIKISDEYHWAFELRGNTYRDLERFGDAVADYSRAIELERRCHVSFEMRGDVYLDLRRKKDALRDFDRAIELEPQCALAHCWRAKAHRAMGNFGHALSDAGRAIELDPKYHLAFEIRGESFCHVGAYATAVSNLTRAIELGEDCHRGYELRGRALFLQGEYVDAITDLDRALEISSKCIFSLSYRGSAYRMMGQFDAAAADYRRVLKFRAPEAEHWCYYQLGLIDLGRGRVLTGRQQIFKAIDVTQAGKARFPKDTKKALNTSIYLSALGRTDEAVQSINATLSKRISMLALWGTINDFKELRAALSVDVSRQIALLKSRASSVFLNENPQEEG